VSLPWLKGNIAQFIPLVKQQRIPHAILLSAARGMGKVELAKEMAQLAMCENVTGDGACFQCSACELLKAGNHTDLTVIKAENTVIKVSQIRKLTSDVVLTSSKNQYKVIIIEEAEKMNLSSANALLKTLEEPPQKVLIILTTNEVGRLLPTIKSRCVKINIQPISHDVASHWLVSQVKSNTDDIDFALFLADNSPLLAYSILQNKTLDDVKNMVEDLIALQQQSVALLDVSKKWYSNNWHYNLKYVSVILLNDLALKNGLKSNNKREFCFNMNVHEYGLLAFIKSIHQFSKRLELPLKVELQLEKLLLTWKNASSGTIH
jgi:DNA polymerase-3 subunit delta'